MKVTHTLIAIAIAGSLTACSSVDTINGVRMNVSRDDPAAHSFCGVHQVLCVVGGMVITGVATAAIINSRDHKKAPPAAPPLPTD